MSLTDPPKIRRQPIEPPERPPVHPLLWALSGTIVLVHVLQWAASAGLAPQVFDWRVTFTLFAFWDVDFDRAVAGAPFAARLWWTPLTHAFLHANWLHLWLNMAAFLGLGHAVTQAIGFGRFFAAFVLCAVAGALALGVLAHIDGPLVGASGAVFGFLAMLTAWQERALARRGLSRRAIWMRIGGLVLINLVLAVGLGGLLAWEAHLGGFVAGWILGLAWPPQRPGPLF